MQNFVINRATIAQFLSRSGVAYIIYLILCPAHGKYPIKSSCSEDDDDDDDDDDDAEKGGGGGIMMLPTGRQYGLEKYGSPESGD